MPVFSPPAKDKEATLPAPTFSLRCTEPTLPAAPEPATREQKTRARLREQQRSFPVLQAGKRQWVGSRDEEAACLPTRVTRSLVPTTTRTSRLRDKLDPRAGGCVLGLFLAQARTAASAFVDKSSLVDALEEWCTDAADATTTYGHISTWDVRAVTELKNLVMEAPCRSTFDEDINAWDVSQVTNMQAPLELLYKGSGLVGRPLAHTKARELITRRARAVARRRVCSNKRPSSISRSTRGTLPKSHLCITCSTWRAISISRLTLGT